LTASLTSSSDATCNGGSDGTIVVSASGGTAPYSFQITGFPTNTTGNFTALPAASYSVNVTDVNGCLINVPAVINEPAAITFSTDSTLVSCNGGSDGTASVTLANGGTGTLTYQWGINAANQTTATATALAVGTYNFTVTDANNCTEIGAASVTEPTAIVLDSLTTNVSCHGAMDGSAKVLVQGGTIPYTYAWSANANGQTTDSIVGLSGGTYTATVTDGNSCTAIISMYVEEASPIVLTTSMTQATCNGLADGTATVTAIGGTPGANPNQYTYSWSASANNQITATATALNTGLHSVTVTDGAGCTAVGTITVTAPPSMSLTTTSVPSTSCSYSTDGSATVTASGGAGGYTYQWSGGTAPTNTDVIAGLSTGTTYVTVTDVNGCSDLDSVIIAGPPAVVANPTATAISCNGADDGMITLTPTGGTGTLSFAWSNSINTQDIGSLSAGTYLVTITDANNCVFTDTALIIEPDTLIVTAIMTPISCFGGVNGTATALPIGGQGGYAYNWSSGSTDSIALVLSTGTYNLTVTDGAGCTDTTSILVTQPSTAVSSTISGTDLFCNSDGSGTATIVGADGTPGIAPNDYTYLWAANANNQTTATATGLQAGTYNVTVTDGNGCTTTNSIIINEPTALGGTTTGLPASCFGSTDGGASIAPTGGTTPYSYQWSPTISADSFVTNVAAGWHLVTVTDANNCIYIDSFEVLQPSAITTTTTVDSTLCNNDATGVSTVSATGGTGTYTYLWSASANNQTTATATNLAAGTHSVTVTDANSCTSIAMVQVLEPLALATTTSVIDAQCFGAATGSATVSGTGGTLNYTYLWDATAASATTATAANLTAGTYYVTLTDANGCTAVDSATVGQPANGVSTTISGTDLFCNGDLSGTVTVVPIGGTGAGYTFLWDDANGQTTATATGLAAGTYTVIVSDGNGCNVFNSVTINEPTVLSGTISGTPASCFGVADGTAMIIATGGTTPYNYQWSPTISVDSFVTNVAAGLHIVTVTDANNCTYIDSFEVLEPIGITTVMSTTAVLCNGGSTGTAAVNASGGNGGFTYAWSPNGATTANAINLAAGWHYVTVTDLNGCFTIDSVEVLEPTLLTLTTTQIEVDCFGQSTGSATVNPNGGTAGYTYLWNAAAGSQVSQTATNLPAGIYEVTVTDANGCTEIISVTINQPATGVEITGITNTEVNCFGGSDGTATVQVTGGAGNYTYNWTPSTQTGQTATGLSIGTYIVITTDVNGCFAIDSVIIDQPSPITTIFTNVTGSSCYQGNDGTATIGASGGVPSGTNGYTYVWNTIPQQQGATATNLIGGQTYSVLVTDANGCTTTDQVTIPQPDPVTLTTTQTNVSCFGFTDATATVIPAGGTPGFTFQWDANAGNQTNATATGLPFGNYAVTVTDFFGCSAVTGVTITQPAVLVTNKTTVDILCTGGNTGEAQVLMSGGTGPYYINWQGGLIDPPTNLAAGTYRYSVTDGNGCELSDSLTINEPSDALTAQKESVEVTCYNDRDGIINIYPNGGNAPYEYSLNGTNYDDNGSKIGLTAGDYTFYIRDDNGCVYTETVTIGEPDEFTVDLGLDIDIQLGESVNLEAMPTNGIPNYTYVWTPIENFSCTDCATPTVDSLEDDRYITVMVTDERGCEAEDDVYIRISKPRYVFIANAFTPNGDGNNDYLFVQGGNGSEKVLSFRVYDRWGELIFEVTDGLLNDTSYGWNGRYKDQDLNAGLFVWVAEVGFEDGETLIYKGSTILIK
jgi:gliding motility-associated-like protein